MDKNAYSKSGVDVNAGYESVNLIKKFVDATKREGCLGGLGSFGGLFDLSKLNYKNPVLVSGTDGVGTKLLIANMMDKHDTIGIDCVAMCVNDIIAQGAEPLFFLDYIATGHNVPKKIENIVKGISEGCKQSNCALIGGETAEMPGFYKNDDYDIAGFAVGIAEKNELINKDNVKAGDVLIGLASSGLHSNGYSLVRKVFFEDNNLNIDSKIENLNKTLGEEILTPTRIYVKSILELLKNVKVHGIAHITGGGFIENIPRMIPDGLCAVINKGSWEIPEIFNILKKYGNLKNSEEYEIFNMGIGMILAVSKEDVEKSIDILKNNEQVYLIGNVIKDSKEKIILHEEENE